MVYNKTNPNWK